jgi:hypothetical protein
VPVETEENPMKERWLHPVGALAALALLLTGCPNGAAAPTIPGPASEPAAEFTVVVECSCTMDVTGGEAHFDANGDGVLDPTDQPLRGASYVLRYADGTEFKKKTDADGKVSMGVCYPTRDSPCTGRRIMAETMEPPRGYELVRHDCTQYLFRKAQK